MPRLRAGDCTGDADADDVDDVPELATPPAECTQRQHTKQCKRQSGTGNAPETAAATSTNICLRELPAAVDDAAAAATTAATAAPTAPTAGAAAVDDGAGPFLRFRPLALLLLLLLVAAESDIAAAVVGAAGAASEMGAMAVAAVVAVGRGGRFHPRRAVGVLGVVLLLVLPAVAVTMPPTAGAGAAAGAVVDVMTGVAGAVNAGALGAAVGVFTPLGAAAVVVVGAAVVVAMGVGDGIFGSTPHPRRVVAVVVGVDAADDVVDSGVALLLLLWLLLLLLLSPANTDANGDAAPMATAIGAGAAAVALAAAITLMVAADAGAGVDGATQPNDGTDTVGAGVGDCCGVTGAANSDSDDALVLCVLAVVVAVVAGVLLVDADVDSALKSSGTPSRDESTSGSNTRGFGSTARVLLLLRALLRSCRVLLLVLGLLFSMSSSPAVVAASSSLSMS